MDQPVSKVGEKFTFNGETLTVKCFFGPNGEEFETAKECQESNRNGPILVKNVEYGGSTSLDMSIKAE